MKFAGLKIKSGEITVDLSSCPVPPGSWSHLGVQGKCIKPHGADEIDVSSLVKYRAGQRSHAREYHWHFTFKARSSFFFFSFLYLKFDKEEIFHAKLREDAWP